MIDPHPSSPAGQPTPGQRVEKHRLRRDADGSRSMPYPGSDTFRLPAPRKVPELFRHHRSTHGMIIPTAIDLSVDRTHWQSLAPSTELCAERQALIVHVLSRLHYAASRIVEHLEPFHAHLNRQDDSELDIRGAVLADSRRVVELCHRYRSMVAGVNQTPERSLTSNYRVLVDTVLPEKFRAYQNATSADTPRAVSRKAESELRTVYHLIVEGLGATSAISGLRLALTQLPPGGELPGLQQTVNALSMTERRNIAYGLYRLQQLGNESWWGTNLTVIRTFRRTRPILEGMRKETFDLWPQGFPFDIDRAELQRRTAQHVRGWIKRLILRRYGELQSFQGVVE